MIPPNSNASFLESKVASGAFTRKKGSGSQGSVTMNVFLDAKTPEDSIYMAQTSNTAMQSKVECRLTCNNCNAIVYATGMGRYGNHVVLFNTGEAGLEISDDEEDLDLRFALALSKTETLTAVTTTNTHLQPIFAMGIPLLMRCFQVPSQSMLTAK
jgi:hypothetical protein